MPALVVERPGLLTTVQDEGRWGYQSLGVPVSGPMDMESARAANALVGNPRNEALLEVTWLGPTLRVDGGARLAVTGAAFEVRIGEETLRTPLAIEVADGVTIAFGRRIAGCRAYVAVAGGLSTPSTLGSRSTHVLASLGGRALARGDRLPIGGAMPGRPARLEDLPAATLPGRDTHLRMIPAGLDAWSTDARAGLCQASYQLTPQSDRMGYRLDGPVPWPEAPGTLPSGPVVTGAIQIPSSGGTPILLMADRQTTGGYAIVGVVCEADLAVAGQLAPGDRIRFSEIDLAEAIALSTARRQVMVRWLGA
jgi:antagonist of KipI